MDMHANSIIKHSILFENKIIKLSNSSKTQFKNIQAIWVFYNLVSMRIQASDKSRSLKFCFIIGYPPYQSGDEIY